MTFDKSAGAVFKHLQEYEYGEPRWRPDRLGEQMEILRPKIGADVLGPSMADEVSAVQAEDGYAVTVYTKDEQQGDSLRVEDGDWINLHKHDRENDTSFADNIRSVSAEKLESSGSTWPSVGEMIVWGLGLGGVLWFVGRFR